MILAVLCILAFLVNYGTLASAKVGQDSQEDTRKVLESFEQRLSALEGKLGSFNRTPAEHAIGAAEAAGSDEQDQSDLQENVRIMQKQIKRIQEEISLLQAQVEDLKAELSPHLELIPAY